MQILMAVNEYDGHQMELYLKCLDTPDKKMNLQFSCMLITIASGTLYMGFCYLLLYTVWADKIWVQKPWV